MESTVLGSRYELLERVGMGGMAVVYKAKDKMLNRFVAIKILREEFKENEDFIRRFKIESQAAASLSHQNIAQIYDVGEENGMNYIVMEFLEGVTLKKYILDNKGALSRKEAMNFSMQICRALEHAHSKYVVHRDIKPQNIVITESGKLKLADFGIARAANNTTTVNSKNNVAVGSAHYLSPEQARGRYTDNRSDIYSLGVVMYEMFCGKLPFDAEENVSVVMQHLHEEPVPPCEVNPDLPEGIEAIILKAMKKEQRLRYENASQILEDLVLVYQNPSIDVSALHASESEEAPAEKKERSTKSRRPANKNQKKQKNKKKQKSNSLPFLIITLLLFSVLTFAGITIFNKILHPDTGEEVEIPNVVGLTLEEAQQKAEQASTNEVTFTVLEDKSEFSDKIPAGVIMSQDPLAGGKVKRSRQIDVVVSKGPVVLTLENYEGRHIDAVKEYLESKGIKVESTYVDAAGYSAGEIVSQITREGTELAKGDTVEFKVAKETDSDLEQTQTIVPHVIGKTEDGARDLLEEMGLKCVVKEDDESDAPKGSVVRVSHEEGSTVLEGETITIYVSTGKNTPKEPEKPQEPEKPEEPEKPKKETVSLALTALPQNKTIRVRIGGDSGTVFEADINSSTGTQTVTFESDGSSSYDVYFDNVFKYKKEV